MCTGCDSLSAVKDGATTNAQDSVHAMVFRQFHPFTDFGFHRVTYDTAKFYMLDAVIGKILADRIKQAFSFNTFASVAQQDFTCASAGNVGSDSILFSGTEFDSGWVVVILPSNSGHAAK